MAKSHQSAGFRMIRAAEDRTGDPQHIGPDVCVVKVSASDTDGAFTLFEYTGNTQGGPPLHVHMDQDEIFVVREGQYLFQCGEDRTTLGVGDTIFLPRGIPHSFRQMSDLGHLQYMYTPAGDMEAFFAALSRLDDLPSPEIADALFSAHGMTIVGPPLGSD